MRLFLTILPLLLSIVSGFDFSEPYHFKKSLHNVNCENKNTCLINTTSLPKYDDIKRCEVECLRENTCKGYSYLNETTEYTCKTFDTIDFYNFDDKINYDTYIKKEKKCEKWCYTHKIGDHLPVEKKMSMGKRTPTSWNTRCYWEDAQCSGCPECKGLGDVCEEWCDTHSSFWPEKCGWKEKYCSGCWECKNLHVYNISCDKEDAVGCSNSTINTTLEPLCHYNKTSIFPWIVGYHCPHMCDLCESTTLTTTQTTSPTSTPTTTPTSSQTTTPTSTPTTSPTSTPTTTPTTSPTSTPTTSPTTSPTSTPTTTPTTSPTSSATSTASTSPTSTPTTTSPTTTQTTTQTTSPTTTNVVIPSGQKDTTFIEDNYLIIIFVLVGLCLCTNILLYVLIKKKSEPRENVERENVEIENNRKITCYDNPIYERSYENIDEFDSTDL